jgi:hypothetical protein
MKYLIENLDYIIDRARIRHTIVLKDIYQKYPASEKGVSARWKCQPDWPVDTSILLYQGTQNYRTGLRTLVNIHSWADKILAAKLPETDQY